MTGHAAARQVGATGAGTITVSRAGTTLASVMALIDPATVNAGHFEKRI